MTTLTSIHSDCANVFRSRLFAVERDGVLGVSHACDVYDAIVADCLSCQDCIGENLNHLLRQIVVEWFERYVPKDDLAYYFCHYVLLLNLCVERIDYILIILHKAGNFAEAEALRATGTPSLRQVRRWANFFKHPKQFLFAHWPRYCLATSCKDLGVDDVVVDDAFVAKHYRKNGHDPVILERNARVVVAIPDLIALTESFCVDLNKIFAFICTNEPAVAFLRNCSLIQVDYGDNEGEDDASGALDRDDSPVRP